MKTQDQTNTQGEPEIKGEAICPQYHEYRTFRPIKGKGMTDRLIYAWVNGKPAPDTMEFPDKS